MSPRGRQIQRSEASMAKALDASLALFSSKGYGATSMREIAEAAEISVGNLYHHFGSKETIFQKLLDSYFERLLDPESSLNRVFAKADFPADLEVMAEAIEESVGDNTAFIMLIFIDVIEFRGSHIRHFYETMAERFQRAYGASFERQKREGRLGEVNPLVGVMVATRWLFYFYTVEKCFGVPMHFGMNPRQAVDEFIRIFRYGVLPRSLADAAADGPEHRGGKDV